MSRVTVGVRSHLTEFVREPLNAVLIVALPIVGIEMYGTALSTFPPFAFGDISVDPATLGRISGAMFAMAALAGIIGLFQVINANEADRRVILAGYPIPALLASRLITVFVIDIVAASASTATLMTRMTVEAPVIAFGGLLLAGIFYSAIGVLVGSVLSRQLEGSLAIVFLVDMDTILSSGIIPVDTDITKVSPLHYPHELFSTAVTDGTVASDALLPALLYIIVLAILATGTYVRANSVGGDRA